MSTQISGFPLTYLNNRTLFEQQNSSSHVLKMLNYDGLWENKKLSDENQGSDWIKSIH